MLRPRYRPTASFRTYLYGIVVRLCLDHAKRKRPVYTDRVADKASLSPASDNRLIQEERDKAVRDSLAALPANQRMATILKYDEGLTYGEIASAMKLSPKAVERLLARARAALDHLREK